jgi:hypothetical protein
MRPIFTIHAGEFLVGQHIESKFKDKNVWVPTKDRGLDLLVTDGSNKRALSIQVKFSRDFLPLMKLEPAAQKELRSCTWFTLDRDKIAQSTADIWVLVLLGFEKSTYDFVIISPRELVKRLEQLHPELEKYQTYVWVTKHERAWLTRGISKDEQMKITANTYDHKLRDLSLELNNWSSIEQL